MVVHGDHKGSEELRVGGPMIELWKDIPGHPGYQASDQGRIRSIERYVNFAGYFRKDGSWRGPSTRKFKSVILKPAPHSSGHLGVVLGRKSGTLGVHLLILKTFVGPKPEMEETLHLNHNPADNRLVNLKYGSRSENLRMDYEVGTRTVHPSFTNAGNYKK